MIEIVISSITAIVVVGGGIGALARWVGRIDVLSSAMDRLTSAMETTGNTLLDHEKRITRLEARDEHK